MSNKPPPRQLKPRVGVLSPPPGGMPVVHERLTALQERDLVIAAERGDSDACQKLVEAFLPAIRDLARNSKNPRVDRARHLHEPHGRPCGASSGGCCRPAPRCATIRHHTEYTFLGLRLVLGPQSDA